MNCKQARQRIHMTPKAGAKAPAPDLAAHLQTCPDCRRLREQLAAVDGLAAERVKPAPALLPAVMAQVRLERDRQLLLRGWREAGTVTVGLGVLGGGALLILRAADAWPGLAGQVLGGLPVPTVAVHVVVLAGLGALGAAAAWMAGQVSGWLVE
jgi:predicted anti-sigma-YlaC factor YlaD